jgi:hypothetical protein
MADFSPNRPLGYEDALGQLNQDSFTYMAFRGAYTGTNLIYMGRARPGASETHPIWQIAMLAYDGSNNLLSIKWAVAPSGSGSADFEFIWNNGIIGAGHIGYDTYSYA